MDYCGKFVSVDGASEPETLASDAFRALASEDTSAPLVRGSSSSQEWCGRCGEPVGIGNDDGVPHTLWDCLDALFRRGSTDFRARCE